MKKILIFLTFMVVNLNAAFEYCKIGPRAAGLGGAYTAIADDIYSIYYNPAGLTLLPRMELTVQYSRPFIQLTDGSAISQFFCAYGLPTKYGTLAVAPLIFAVNNMYNEFSLLFSYARQINDDLSIGLTPKILSIGYTAGDINNAMITNERYGRYGSYSGSKDPLFNGGTSKTVFSFDLGLQYSLGANYRFGLSILDIFEPNISLVNDPDVKVARKINIGFSNFSNIHSFNFELKLSRFNSKKTDWSISAGVERVIASLLALRLGVVYGARDNFHLSAGLGFITDRFNVDYAMLLPFNGMINSLGTHQAAISFKFGPVVRMPVGVKEYEEKLLKAESELKEAQEKLKAGEEKIIALKKELILAKTESEKSRKEIEILKKKIEELLVHPPTLPTSLVASTVPPVVEIPTPVLPSDIVPGTTELEAEYKKDMEFYKKKDSEKVPFKDLYFTIDEIVKKYQGKGIDISEAEKIYRDLSARRETFISEYKKSMSYYEKLVKIGAEIDELRDVLRKIINKYKDKIPVTEAEDELKKLK